MKPHASKGQGRCVKVSGAKNLKIEFFFSKEMQMGIAM